MSPIPMIKKNPSQEEYDRVAAAVAANDGYCCCAIEHTPDVICPCVPFRMSNKTGPCECGRYYKVEPHQTVTICGSTRFKDEMIQLAKDMTKQGYIVLMPMLFAHSGDVITDEEKEQLDELHFAKIEKADIVYIVNPNGYVGESTRREIEWARFLHKQIVSDVVLED